MVSTGRAFGKRRIAPRLVGLGLVLALAILVSLQARWLGELAEAQREETRRRLQVAAARIAGEFQAVLTGIQDAVTVADAPADASSIAPVRELIPLDPDEEPVLDAPSFIAHGLGHERWLVVLDTDYLESELFPALARTALGESDVDTYRISVVAIGADVPPLYESHPGDPIPAEGADVTEELYLIPNRWSDALNDPEVDWLGRGSPIFITEGEPGPAQVVGRDPRWRIELQHRAGSLELALSRARGRNFMLAGGTLALLLAGLGFLWVSEQRARRLAERELAFVAGVSHELRTPLAVMRTAASNLARGVVTTAPRVKEYGELIERETTRLAALVERVLRFSAEETALAIDTADVSELIRAAIERCSPWRDRREFEIRVDIGPEVGSVDADGPALVSALHNLIENAIKYGPDGQEIRVSARCADGLTIDVADDGPGIPAGDRGHVFEPFYRGIHGRDGGMPGNGLGLGVAREIARAHGGRLELLPAGSSEPGSVFRLTLPEVQDGAGT